MDEPRELELRRYLQAQRELAALLLDGDSLTGVAPGFLATIADLLRWDSGALWEVVDGEPALRFIRGWSIPELDTEPLWKLSRELSFERGDGLPGRAWESGEVFLVPEVPDDANYPRRELAVELGFSAALAVPIAPGRSEDVLAIAEFHTRSFDAKSELLLNLLTGFAEQLSAFISRRRAESQVREAEQFKSAVMTAALDCIVGMDHEGNVIEFNAAAERLFGHTREQALGRELAALIVPEELRERHRNGLQRYLETGEGKMIDCRTELPALRADGTVIPVELTVTRIPGSEPPIFTGFLRDTTDRADAERVRQHMAEVVRGTQDAVLSKDLEGIVTSWNPAAERLYGYSADAAIGRHISFLIPPDHKDEEQMILDRVRHGEVLQTYETERIRADGARIAVSLTVSPIRSAVHGVVGASVIARDVTSIKRRRQAQEFLLAASRLLDTSLDPDRTARTIVATTVPALAEISVIDFVRADGWLGDSVVAGVDPTAAARLEHIRRTSPLDPGGSHPAAQVLRAGRPLVWRDLKAPEVIDDVAQSDEHRELMDDAGYNSAAVVPLIARGRTLGALSFLHAHGDGRYDPDDLEFLAELGERAALVLDNARLYRERAQIAESLQRGLRPPQPAEVLGLGISVVFEAAGSGIEIGGDVYDVLPTEDGCWILVGDVAGKGSAAAGVSVAVRHAVRGLTREIDEPDEVLSRVNELLLAGSSLNDFATAVLVRMRRDGKRWSLTLASAGHPPAIHATASGPVQMGGGAVLGGWSDPAIARHQTEFGPEDTLVLCTDGWLEAGPVASHRDADAFAATAQSLAGLELSELTAKLRTDALERGSGGLRDDLVVLAVRPAAGARTDEDATAKLIRA
ncbi:MAG TPA: PAS domain S-box protein [Solirubrobacterales bacterium]|nr:PAS domain S-box protein [Solirubrobacterales bacterium]